MGGRHRTDGMPKALSIRQPWAGLLVAGLKSVEVRTWPTRYRGRLLIHAAQRPDGDARGWQRVAQAAATCPGLWELCTLRGGIIGQAELVDCWRYTSIEQFAADQQRHLVAAHDYQPGIYGFLFRNPQRLVYHAYRGQTFLFIVEGFHSNDSPIAQTPIIDQRTSST